ncbi:MAG TPA: hypothetical protein VF021_04905, partial [Longimicrobiales bacterium]
VELGIGLVEPLADPLDDACARGIRQLSQLIEMLVGEVRRDILVGCANQNGAFFRRLYVLQNNDMRLPRALE